MINASDFTAEAIDLVSQKGQTWGQTIGMRGHHSRVVEMYCFCFQVNFVTSLCIHFHYTGWDMQQNMTVVLGNGRNWEIKHWYTYLPSVMLPRRTSRKRQPQTCSYLSRSQHYICPAVWRWSSLPVSWRCREVSQCSSRHTWAVQICPVWAVSSVYYQICIPL